MYVCTGSKSNTYMLNELGYDIPVPTYNKGERLNKTHRRRAFNEFNFQKLGYVHTHTHAHTHENYFG